MTGTVQPQAPLGPSRGVLAKDAVVYGGEKVAGLALEETLFGCARNFYINTSSQNRL